MTKIKKLILASLLLACSIVLGRFLSIKTPIIVVSFAFIPKILSGILLGPWWTMLLGVLSDLIGALLFPFGAYFVGYTISAGLSGLFYGLFMYNAHKKSNKQFIISLCITIFVQIVVCNVVLNSLWIYLTTKKAIALILPTRLIKQLVMFPIEVAIMFSLNLGLKKVGAYKFLEGNGYETEDKTTYDTETENQPSVETETENVNNETETTAETNAEASTENNTEISTENLTQEGENNDKAQ